MVGKYFLFCTMSLFFIGCSVNKNGVHTKATKKIDYIGNNSYRDWWNVIHYTLNLQENFVEESFDNLEVVMEIVPNKVPNNPFLQFDLNKPMHIKSIAIVFTIESKKIEFPIVNYKTNGDAHILDLQAFLSQLKNAAAKKESFFLRVESFGKPAIAASPPWDGGWVFAEDKLGRPWFSAAVQGIGCAAWFPCKNYLGDSPENGVDFFTVKKKSSNWTFVSNGKKIETNDKTKQGWKTQNPIDNYNIIPYYGFYEHFADNYKGLKGDLSLDYYPLDYNLESAKNHFTQVKPMLACFEEWLGPFPFYEDGYKLVEAPYAGMEHQSAIAYGNYYKNGYNSIDVSHTGWGLNFDYIIIHESAHEWFGNSITVEDFADMWVQEGFTTYSETLYVECQYGKKAANEYILGTKRNIINRKPIQGKLGIGEEGSDDVYYKMANVIHTLRYWLADDEKFKAILLYMNKKFFHQIVTGNQIEDFFAEQTKINLKPFFEQYLRSTKIPILEYYTKEGEFFFRFTNVVEGFSLPIVLNNQKIIANENWSKLEINTEAEKVEFDETPLINFLKIK